MNNTPHVLAGRYRVGELVYSDANGNLHRGYDQLLNRAVGIELLTAGVSPALDHTLQDKARRMVQAELPHVAALYDQGEQDGHSFLVIEELAHRSLAEAAPLTPAATADLVSTLAATLRAAAQKRVAPPRMDANTVRMTEDGLFQIVNWGSASGGNTNDVALITPLLALAVTGSEQGAQQLQRVRRGEKRSPLERIVERAAGGHYTTLDLLVADVETAKNAADDPTIVVRRGRPTVMVPVEPVQEQRVAPVTRRPPWLPILLAALVLLAGGAFFGRSLFGQNQTTGEAVATPTITQATPAPDAPPPTRAEVQGQPFVVTTIRGQRLNVRGEPNQSAAIVGKLNNGDSVRVLEGPVPSNGLRWARIQADGVEGWCVYDALSPQ